MKKLSAFISTLLLLLLCGCFVPQEYYFRKSKVPQRNVKIAALLPISGKNKATAERVNEGLKFAVFELNQRHGVNGKQIDFKVFDTRGTESGSIEAVRKAASWGSVAVLSGVDSDEAAWVIPHAAKSRMPVMLVTATKDDLSLLSPFVYRVTFTDTQQMDVLAGFLSYWRQKKSYAIIVDNFYGGAYERDLSASASKAVKSSGGTVVCTESLNRDGTFERGIFLRVLRSDPDVIIVCSTSGRGAQILKLLRNYGYGGVICGPDSWDNDDFISGLGNFNPGECFYTSLASQESEFDEFRKFNDAFRKKNFYFPGVFEIQSYDAMRFLCFSLDKAEHLVKFDKNWCTIRNHCGAAALYTMKKKGELDRTVYIKSLGVSKDSSGKYILTPRQSHKLQHSKLKEYNENYFNVK